MIHLSIQDIALLANLAGCCNSVDDFAEYAIRTYGTNSALLSGQDEPAEFVVSFQNLENLNMSPTQRQMSKAYETIKRLKASPDNISYKTGEVTTIDQIRMLTGGRDLADLATMVYAGIYKLKFDSTDYRAYLYNTLIFKLIKGPVGFSYSTIGSIISPTSGDRGAIVDDYKGLTYTTFSRLTHPRDERLYNILSIDQLQQPDEIDRQIYYISPKKILHGQRLDEMINYLSPKVIYHQREGHEDKVIDSPVSYNSPRTIYHHRQPIDSFVSYNSIRTLYHTRLADSDCTIDSPVSYNSPRTIYHTRQTDSENPVDGGGNYASPKILYHTRQTDSENPIDGAGNYPSPKILYHTRQTDSENPVDGAGNYASPKILYHTRQTDSENPVDGAGNYPAINELEYRVSNRYGMGGSYPTLNRVEYQLSKRYGPVVTHTAVDRVVYDLNREDHLAHNVMSLNLLNYPVWRDDYVVGVAQSIKSTKYWKLGDYKAGWVFSMKSTKYWDQKAHVAYIAQTLYEVKYPLQENYRATSTMGLAKTIYSGTGDVYVQLDQTMKRIHDQLPSYCRSRQNTSVIETKLTRKRTYVANYSTVLGINFPRSDNSILSVTVRDTSLTNRLDKINVSQTIQSIEHKKPERPVDYSTVSSIRHKPGSNVHCDDTVHNWNDYYIDTTHHEYNRATNIYGVSKLRITLFQHFIFDTDMLTTTTGWLENWSGTPIPNLPNGQPTTPNTKPISFSTGYMDTNGLVNSADGTFIHRYPIGPGNVAISDIKVYKQNEKMYSLSADDIIMETCNCRIDWPWEVGSTMHGIVGNGQLSAAIDGNLVMTDTIADIVTGGLMVHNEPMCLTFHLPETVDIKYVDIAPVGFGKTGTTPDWSLHAPGWVHIEGYYPGCADWFTMSFEHTPNRYIPDIDFEPWNNMKRTWTPGKYTRFLVVDGMRHHKPRQIYNPATKLHDSVYDVNPVLLRCCNNLTTIMGVSGYSLAHDLKPRGGNSLYAVGTAGYG